MFTTRISRVCGVLFVLGLAMYFGGLALPARADTYTWTSAGTSWTGPADWFDVSSSTGTVPGSLDIAQFTLPSYTNTATLSAVASLGGLWDTGSGPFRISGSTLTLNGASINGGTANTGIELDPTAGNLLITSSLSLGASQWWINNANTATSTLSESSALNLNGKGLTISGSGNTFITGTISGSGALAGSLTINGPGQVTLSTRGNTYSGGTIVNGGTLIVSATNAGSGAGAVGPGPVTVNSGGTILMSGTASTNQNEFLGHQNVLSTSVVRINAGGLIEDPNGVLNYLGTMILDGGTLAAVKAINGGNWVLSGSVSTAGDGQTSYMAGGSMMLNQSGSNIFNILGGDTLVISSSMGGNAPVKKVGSGLLVIAGSDADSQTLGITAGTLQVCTGQPGGDGTLSAKITDNATLVFDPNVSLVYAGQITGSGSVLKMGGGTLGLTGASQDPGSTNILSGWVNVGRNANINPSNGSLVASTLGLGPILLNGGTLAINGFTTQQPGLSGNGGMLVAGSAASTVTLTPTAAMNFFGSISGPVSVTLNSTTAVQTFSGPNNNTGQITVSAGTLALAGNGTLGNGINTINPGGVLDTSAISGGYNFSAGVLVAGRTDNSFATDINGSLNLLSGATLSPAGAFTVGAVTVNGGMSLGGGTIAYDAGDQIVLSGALGFSNTSFFVPTAPLTNGTYTLVTAASVPGSVSQLAVGGFFTQSPRQTFTFDSSTGTAVTLTVSGAPGTLTWTGGSNYTWDSGASQNWFNTTTQLTDYFYVNDLATFDDSAGTAAGNVTIAGTGVYPGSVTVSNTAVSYTFSNGPILGAGFLLKTGPGALTINNSNGYTGGTTLAAGLLNLGNSAALGSGRLTISGGSLDNTSGTTMTLSGNIAQTFGGGFTFVGSNPLNIGTGAVTLAAASDIYVSASTLTVGGYMGGGGHLTKDGPGTLVLAASSGYGSGTTLNNGVLVFVNHGLGTGGITLNGGTLQYASGNTYDASGNGLTLGGTATVDTNGNNVTWQQFNGISGAGSLVKIGSGTLTLGATNSYSGSTTVNNGTLTLSGYQYGSGNNYSTVWGTLAGGPLNINSGGLVNLSEYALGVQTSQRTPVINISGGTLSSSSAIGWGTNITMTAGAMNGTLFLGAGATINITGTNASALINAALAVSDSANLTFNVSRGAGAADLIVLGSIGYGDPFGALDADPIGGSPPNYTWRSQPSLGWETGGVVLNGNGMVVFGGSNSYYGNTTINGGTLQVGMGGAAATLPVYQQLALGTFGPTALGPSGSSAITDNGTLAFSSTDSLIQGVHFSALPITGAGSVVQLGPGNLTLNAANAYTGGTTLSGGSLTVANASALGGSGAGPLTVNAGLLNLNGYSVSATGFGGSGGTITSAAPAVLSVAPTANSNFAGTIAGAISFSVNAPGASLTLAGANTYTGLTTVTAGTLAGTLGSGGLVVAPGAVADVSSYGSSGYAVNGSVLTAGRPSAFASDIVGNVNVQNSLVSPAGTGTVGTMTISGSLGLSGGTLVYDPGDQIALGGALTLGGTDYVVPTGPVASGVYTLITATGVPASASSFAVGGLFSISPRQQFIFASSGGTAVTLTVNGNVGNLTWTGGVNNTWDNGASTSWFNSSTGSADVFSLGDLVTFDDTAGTANSVNINDTVQPAIVTFNNNAVNFTLGGSGSIVGGGSLVKNGTGAVTISTSNTYTGGTTINDGALNANVPQAIGSGPLAVAGGTFNGNAAQSPASVTLTGGLLNLGSSAALGGGPLTISGGSLDNTSGSAMTLGGNIPQNWGGSFTFVGSNPLNTGTGAVTLTSTALITVANSNLTVAGVISGSGGLGLIGPGTLTLAASNSYSGGTGLLSGVLSFVNGGLGSGTVALGGGTLQYAAGNTQDISSRLLLYSGTAAIDTQSNNVAFASPVSGGGSLLKLGAGALALNAANSYTGGTTVNAGTLSLGYGNGGVGTLQGTLTINPGATVVTAVNNALGYAGTNWVQNININGGVLSTAVNSDNGWGTTINMTAGTMSTTVAGGYFAMGNSPVFNITGTNASAVISANLTDRDAVNGIVFNLARGNAPADLIVSGGILNAASGAGITLNGNGIIVLGGADTYNGPTAIDGGVLQVGNSAALGSGAVAVNGGTLDLAGYSVTLPGFSGAAGAVTNSASSTVATLTVSQGNTPTVFNGSIADGAGRVALAVRSGTLVLANTGNDYSGGTSVYSNAATTAPPVLQMGANNALPYGAAAGNVSVSGSGTLDLSGFTANINGLSGNGKIDDTTGNGALVVGNDNATSTFSGVMQNSGSAFGATLALTKVGSGTLTLTGTGTYSGGTTVADGTLIVTGNESLADGSDLAVGFDVSLFGTLVPAQAAPATVAPAAAVVPEPGGLALLAAAAGLALPFCRRRRR